MSNSSQNVDLRPFLFRVVLPALLAIVMCVIAIFIIIIPAFERKVMEDKKAMIRELTHTAWSILDESDRKVKSGEWTLEQAQQSAIERVRDMHYGRERKDYFWITDTTPRMIVHPYRPELNGKDLRDFRQYGDRRLFVELAGVVQQSGSGYLQYLWQWKDDPSRIVPKLSYVEGFQPWGWIIGTGVYLDDVEHEIRSMKHRLTLSSLGIVLAVALLLSFLTHESLKTERNRAMAENRLLESKEKYKALVGATTEGLVMILEGEYSYSNPKTRELLGCYTEREFAQLPMFDPTIEPSKHASSGYRYFHALVKGDPVAPDEHVQLEKRDGTTMDAMLLSSRISLGEKTGHIVIVRDLSVESRQEEERQEQERERLIEELQTALLVLNQPVQGLMKDRQTCNMKTPIRKVAAILRKQNVSAVLLTTENGEAVGIVTNSDLAQRAIAENFELDRPAFEIMSSPIISVFAHALAFEAALIMQERQVNHLVVRDRLNKIVGLISMADLLQLQSYSSAALLRSLERAQTVDQIAELTERVPRLVKALIDSGAKARNVTRIMSSVSEHILHKLISLAIDELGEPPVNFAFLTLGSEGREEETLITDQDNAIVYENIPSERAEEAETYFAAFADLVCGWLDEVGYSFCEGGIMAKTLRWRQPLDRWKEYFSEWIRGAGPDDLLKVNIFFDFRCSHGDARLSHSLRRHTENELREHPHFFLHLAQNCLLDKPPLNMFGNIVVQTSGEHKNTFSIKQAMRMIIGFARVYALQNNIEFTNTFDRLDALRPLGILSAESHGKIADVYNCLMQLRLRHQAVAITSGRPADNFINPKDLKHIELELLKQSLAELSTLQHKLSYDFKGTANLS